jgi:hypothetical protein
VGIPVRTLGFGKKEKLLRLKAHIIAVILTLFLRCHSASAQFGVPTDNDAAMKNIRKLLLSRSERTSNQHLLFVGVVETLGPVYEGVCKQAVDEYVSFRIVNVISGKHQGSQVNTGYINCTGRPLPAPPFTLHGRVIVYCEQMQSHSLKCLTPVEFSDQHLAAVRSWIAAPVEH